MKQYYVAFKSSTKMIDALRTAIAKIRLFSRFKCVTFGKVRYFDVNKREFICIVYGDKK